MQTIVRECAKCPVRGQIWNEGNPYVCKCTSDASNIAPGFQTAGDICLETPAVNAIVDGISFNFNSIYSPVGAKTISYDKEAYNTNFQDWITNTQSDQSGLLSYMYLKAAMNC